MRIDRLQLHNFRNFEDVSFDFSSQITVVTGENGKGKSSLLQGLRLAAGTFLLGLDEPKRLHIQKEDIRWTDADNRFTPQNNCFFHAWGELNDQPIEWKRTLAREGRNTDSASAYPLIAIAESLNSRINERLENNVDLPVICFFNAARLCPEVKHRTLFKKKGSKLKDGYENCLAIKKERIIPLQWIKSYYYKKLKGKDDVLLNAVLKAITTCVPKWHDLEWDEGSDDLSGKYTHNDGTTSFVPFYYLSDGLKIIAGMVAEIAYRCVILNDHLGKEAVTKSRGVVMIDDIDMHLHRDWQRHVIDSLKTAFPRLQFVVTTHSPFIVQSVKQEEMINLDLVNVARSG